MNKISSKIEIKNRDEKEVLDDSERIKAIQSFDLTKHYGEVKAVDNLDLEIPQDIVYGFLGPNGSGKTTTMRMLTTLIKPTSGTAEIMGVDISNRRKIIEKIGYLPEKPALFEELTGLEQLRYIANIQEIPQEEANKRIKEYLDRFDMAEDGSRRIKTYSKGMKQKIGVIQAVLTSPDVVFLDEPTSGLDPRSARTVKDLIVEFSKESTVFLSTHILSVVDELADTVGVLKDGELVTEGSPRALKKRAEKGKEQTLEDVFLEVTADHKEEQKTIDN